MIVANKANTPIAISIHFNEDLSGAV